MSEPVQARFGRSHIHSSLYDVLIDMDLSIDEKI